MSRKFRFFLTIVFTSFCILLAYSMINLAITNKHIKDSVEILKFYGEFEVIGSEWYFTPHTDLTTQEASDAKLYLVKNTDLQINY